VAGFKPRQTLSTEYIALSYGVLRFILLIMHHFRSLYKVISTNKNSPANQRKTPKNKIVYTAFLKFFTHIH